MTQKNKFILIIIAIGFLVFSNSFFNGFVWDDEEQIINNTVIQSLKNIPIIFSGGAFNSGGTGKLLGIYYKPLMTLSFALIYSVFKLNPFFYHLITVSIHIVNAILVYFLFKKFFCDSNGNFKSLLLSILFLVHPLYSEVFLYSANMQDLLYFLFGMTSLLLLIYKKINLKLTSLVSLLFLASLLSKETGIIFIAISGVYCLIFDRKKIKWLIMSGAISILFYSILRFKIAGIYFPIHGLAPISKLTLPERLINIPAILNYYILNFFWPSNLAINQHWVVKAIGYWNLILPLGIVFLFLKKNKNSLFFASIFILGILPHIQIFPLDVTVSGRWFYVASVGLLGAFGVLLKKGWEKVLIVPIVILSVITFVRTFDFRNGLTLYSHDISYDKNNFNLENNLGVELFRIGKIDEAGEHWQRSVELAPTWWTNYNNLGVYYQNKNDLEKAENLYLEAIKNGNYYLAYENYASVLLKQGKYEKAKEFLIENIKYFPQNSNLSKLLELSYYLLEVSKKNAY